MILWISLYVALSFSYESITSSLYSSDSIDCEAVHYRLAKRGESYDYFFGLSKLKEKRFTSWQEARYFKGIKRRKYLKVLEEMQEVGLLLYMADFPYLHARSIEIRAEWPLSHELKPKDLEFHLPGYMPMNLDTLNSLRGVWFEHSKDTLHFRMLVSPITYCSEDKILVLGESVNLLAE